MAKVHIGYDQHGIDGVDDEFIQFIFDVVISLTKLSDSSEVGLVVTDDAFMKKLNKQYRNKDVPTNVLSFVYHETNPKDFVPEGDENYIGDIYISHQQVEVQAKMAKMTDKEELARLFIHGLLHLAGIHHGNKTEATEMEELEDQALRYILSTG
nr:hypothetical protein [uncultured bacterium]